MPKMKTHNATRKRVTISKKKKFLARRAGQDHFNARESGKTTGIKRRDRAIAKVNRRAIKRVLPYYKKRA